MTTSHPHHDQDLAALLASRSALRSEYAELRRQLAYESVAPHVADLLGRLSARGTELAQLEQVFESSRPSTGEPAPGPAESQPLTLRCLVEGPPGAGATAVVDQLMTKFRATYNRATTRNRRTAVDLVEFEAGVFEGRSIQFQVIRAAGDTGPGLRRFLRSIVDTIIVVIEAQLAGMPTARGYVGELVDDRCMAPSALQPELIVFANKADLPGALDAERTGTRLLLDKSVPVVTTSRDQGFLYGFVLATNAGVRRTQRRDRLALPRSRPLGFEELRQFAMAELRQDQASGRHPEPPPSDRRAASQPPSIIGLSEASSPNPEPPEPPAPIDGQPSHQPSSPDRQPPVMAPSTVVPSSNGHGPRPSPPGRATDRARTQSQVAPPKDSGRVVALRRLIAALRGPDADGSW